MTRAVKLQINQRGAWRNALSFDLDTVDTEALQVAAQNLVVIADPSGSTALRIATDDAEQRALIRWDADKGWKNA